MRTPKLELEAPRIRRPRKTLLVVEDDFLLRWSVRQALRRDYRIVVAGSAEEALEILPAIKNLDGVLVDIRLPGMDGLAFAREARAFWPKAKVFVMTACDRETAPRDASRIQADGYLPKPFLIETLRDMLERHLA